MNESDVISLFFKKYHIALEATLFKLLSDDKDSFCLLANPARGDSELEFFKLAEKRFIITGLERDDFLIQQMDKLKLQPDYNPDTDNIKLYKLHKK